MAQVLYKVIQAKDFLKARPTGEVDLAQSRKMLGDIAQMVSGTGQFDILIDVRGAFGHLTHDEVWELVGEFGQRRNTFRNKIALLTREDEQFNRAVFAEMCANMTAHTYRLSAFTEYEDAVEWLQEASGLEDLWK